MSKEVLEILNRIGLERNIPVESLYDALEAALISASKKMLPPDVDVVEAELDRESGEFRIYANMEVVEEIVDENTQISLEEARQFVEDVEHGEELVIDVTPEDFGRIAAQSAKQVITQRLREAEREVIYDKYKNRTGDLVVGTVQRYEKGNVIVDLGNADAVLPSREQPQGERYRYGDRVKAIIKEIQKSSKDAQIILSRTMPELVLELFQQEVTEIRDGVVSIRLIAREPGRRTKIAVLSSDSDVDPVGACVGMKGSRVQMVVQELKGERIDIIEYSGDLRRFVSNSLKPANIESVELDETGDRALLVVHDDELALAIGKNGLNAKLASELTGVHIDIITESQLNAREAEAKKELLSIPALAGEIKLVDALLVRGIINLDDVLDAGVEDLQGIEGFTPELAATVIEQTEAVKNGVDIEATEEDESKPEPDEEASELEAAEKVVEEEVEAPVAESDDGDEPVVEVATEDSSEDTEAAEEEKSSAPA